MWRDRPAALCGLPINPRRQRVLLSILQVRRLRHRGAQRPVQLRVEKVAGCGPSVSPNCPQGLLLKVPFFQLSVPPKGLSLLSFPPQMLRDGGLLSGVLISVRWMVQEPIHNTLGSERAGGRQKCPVLSGPWDLGFLLQLHCQSSPPPARHSQHEGTFPDPVLPGPVGHPVFPRQRIQFPAKCH